PLAFPTHEAGNSEVSADCRPHCRQQRVVDLAPGRAVFSACLPTQRALLLSKGVHPKIVQEILGHSAINITMDTYSHVLPNIQKDAMGRLDEFLWLVFRFAARR